MGSGYWMEHFFDEKQTLNVSLMESKGNYLPIGLMVIKGEYLTQISHAPKKKGYVFEYYRLGQIVYHYTNLVIGTNIHTQTIPRKKSSKE